MQVVAFKRLTAAGVKQEVILEILKDKNNVWAIGSADATVNTKEKFGDLINKTKEYSDLLELIRKQTLTFEQASQEAIDANVAALDLQQRTLQNQFDLDNFELKANIKIAEGEVEKINKQIQDKQDEIDDINFTLKYDKEIGQNLLDDIQENINDAQRKMEIDFDRPLQALSDRSNVLSNDLTLIDKAAEEINEKYNKQEEALTKISQLNSEIAAQEKNRISLADALSQGDISAAAQIANEMRSTAADAASSRSGDLIAAARKAETEGLVSASGMTRAQIEAEQFKISQDSYALEQLRKKAQEAILKLEDQVYDITELREAKLLDIRKIETEIDGLRNKELADKQKILDELQKEFDAQQKILDAALSKIEFQKLKWDEIQIKLDAYKAKLKSATDGELTSMLDMVNKIAAAMAGLSTFNPNSAFIPPTGETPEQKAAREAAEKAALNATADATTAAAEAAAEAAAKAAEDAVENYEALLEAADTAAKNYEAAVAAGLPSGVIDNLAKIAAAAAKAAMDASAAVTKAADAAALAAAALEAAALAADAATKTNGSSRSGSNNKFDVFAASAGGLVPKYFATGGKSIGSDTVPAMLTPGEFVMNKGATKAFGPMLAAMNGSKFPSMLGSVGQSSYGSIPSLISNSFVTQSYPQMSNTSINPMTSMNSANVNNSSTAVYNYNVGINVSGSNTNPQDIARAVMTEIKNVDAQRIRSQRA
jgi:hypothetical protein